jgi:hypothetical protein
MSFRDQAKYLEFLRKFERRFDRKEAEDFKMFLKMHKDEEEFDSITMNKLKLLYEKYNVPVDRSKFEAFFKKKEPEQN